MKAPGSGTAVTRSGRSTAPPAGESVTNGSNGFPDADATNQAPVSNVVINQASPDTDDVLSVTVVATDGDSDPLTLDYQWTLDGGRTSPVSTKADAGSRSQPATAIGVTHIAVRVMGR